MITYFRGNRRPTDQNRSASQDAMPAGEGQPQLSSGYQNRSSIDPGATSAVEHPVEVVAIIEPRALLRECMVRYLAMCGDATVGGCADVEEFLADNADSSPDLIVLSTAHKPPQKALSEIAALREAGKTCPVILLVDSCDPDFTHGALRHGVRGVVPATVSGGVALEIIKLVLAGGTFIPPEALLSRPLNTHAVQNSTHSSLTMREEQILTLLRHGKQNKQIAYELSLSEGTVKVHVHNIMRKFGVRNRTQLIIAVT